MMIAVRMVGKLYQETGGDVQGYFL